MLVEKKPREQLLRKGVVYIFRVKGHKVGDDWVNAGKGKPKRADVKIERVLRVIDLRDDLCCFAYESGFGSLDEWVKRIEERYPNIERIEGYKGYLYRVTKR